MKRINITSLILLIYLIVMAVISWPGDNPEQGYTEYFTIIGGTIVIIAVLRYVQIRRSKFRREQEEETRNRRETKQN